jgi:hypothetical protein
MMLGCESCLDLTFDPTKIPLPNTLLKKVDEFCQKQLKNGAIPSQGEEQIKRILAGSNANQRKNKLRYSWLPISEIHAANSTIDSFIHLSPSERKKLRQTYATQVAYLINQFGLIGAVDDSNITPEQASSMAAAFSAALVEIENKLFQPISRKHVLDRRGPLFRPESNADGRTIRAVNQHILPELASSLREKAARIEKQGQEGVLVGKVESETAAWLPPQYQPPKASDLKHIKHLDFSTMSKRIKEEIEAADRRNRERPPETPLSTTRRTIEIITSPRKRPAPTPVARSRKKPIPKPNDTLSFDQIEKAENACLDKLEMDLERISDVDTTGCLDAIERLFTTVPLTADPPGAAEVAVGDLIIPQRQEMPPQIESENYVFTQPSVPIAGLLDTSDLFVGEDESRSREEHYRLTQLWDKLGLHADTRLQMAAKLCSLVTEEHNSEYYFRVVMGGTRAFSKYSETYCALRNALRYEPRIASEEKAGIMTEMTVQYKMAEDAFAAANREMTMVLGGELMNRRGTLSDLISRRSSKIEDLRRKTGFHMPNVK